MTAGNETLCDAIGSLVQHCIASRTAEGHLLELFTRPLKDSDTCESYLLLPAENTWNQTARAVLYGAGLIWCCIGLAAITGVFMKALESISSTVVEVKRQNPLTGVEQRFYERYWNGTIANLTLLALGTSAPEVCLALIDGLKHLGKPPGELGPGTILGSAAFNTLIILAVCVVAPKPVPVVRKISDYGTFLVELIASLWAYLWLLLIIKVISPGRVSIWEAAATLAQFPLFVLLAYGQDQKWAFAWLGRTPINNPTTLSHSTSNLSLSQLDQPGSPEAASVPTSPIIVRNSLHQNLKFRARAVKLVSLVGRARASTERGFVEESETKPNFELSTLDAPAHWFIRAEYGNTELEVGRERGPEDEFEDISFTMSGLEILTEPLFLQFLSLDKSTIPPTEHFLGQLYADLRGLRVGQRETKWIELEEKDGSLLEGATVSICLELIGREEDEGPPFQLWVEVSSGATDGSNGASPFVGSFRELVPKKRPQVKRPRKWERLKQQWVLQVYDAMTAGGGEEETKKEPSALDLVLHFCAFYWKLLFAVIPPPAFWGGWPAFVACLAIMGGIAALVVEFGQLFACASGLPTFFTAMTFVAVATSLPDLLASRIATELSQDADSAIANINGSNSVNVFLGIGLPWLITSIYDRTTKGEPFLLASADIYEVNLIAFFVTSGLCIGVLALRRYLVGGELGGARGPAIATSLFFAALWVAYVVFCGLRVYGVL